MSEFNSSQPIRRWLDEDNALVEDGLRDKVGAQLEAGYTAKEREWTAQGIDMRLIEKQIMLQVLDQKWKEHLGIMDHLRQGIHLRAYAQKQPKQEYRRESFELFQELLYAIKRDVIRLLSRVHVEREADLEEVERGRRIEQAQRMQYQHAPSGPIGSLEAPGAREQGGPAAREEIAKPQTFVRNERKVGRNEKCPCGSGKKFKHCHGKVA
jgi:preprotein translocase subunit SecA